MQQSNMAISVEHTCRVGANQDPLSDVFLFHGQASSDI